MEDIKIICFWVRQFLAPILLAVLTLAIADNGSHDPNLYQFLDFTRVETSQKNENRPFKWLGKLRRSKNQKPVHSEPESYEDDSPKPINYGDDHSSPPSHNPSFQKAAFKIAPFRLRNKLSKKSKESAQIILPPLPSINQAAASHGPYNLGNYGSKEDSFIFQPGTPYRQTHPTTSPSPINKQPQQLEEPTYSALELAFNAPKPSSKQRSPVQQPAEVSYSSQQTPSSLVTSNPGSEYDADSISSPPTQQSDSRYSKWFHKLRRRKSNQNHPEKPQHDKPSEDAAGIPEPIYYYQNSSPYNPSQQPGATQQHQQPGNGQSLPYSRNPQIANGSPQVAPTRPVNTKQHSTPPSAQSETLNSPVQPINYDSHSETEAPEHPAPPSGNFYSKFMKKIKRNKTQQTEPITVVSQPEPIFSPLQTAYNNPSSDPSVYRHPQTTSPQSTPPLRPANHQLIKPQPTASPAPYSPHYQQGFNQPATAHPEAPTPYSPLGNAPSRPHQVAPVNQKPPTHSLHQESDNFFPPPNRPDFAPTPFQKQSEKGQGNNNEDPEGFFEFGIFPTGNGFFDQNFKG